MNDDVQRDLQRDLQRDFLRDEMRQAMGGRSPDRTAMLNRIAANRADGPRPRGRSWRLAGSAAAVATVLGLGGVAQWAMADDSGPAPTPAAPTAATAAATTPSSSAPATTPPTTAPATTAPATRKPSRAPATTTPAKPSSAPASAGPSRVRGHPGDTQVEKGSLWSDGSVVAAGRSEVTLKAGADLTTLSLTIRVEPPAGLTPDGATTGAPAGLITTAVERSGAALLYHFMLRPGRTLPAGTHVFTARYGGAAGGRDAGRDTYEAYADSTENGENKRLHVYGNFYPAD